MPNQPLLLLHLVWQAYGKERRYTVLVNGTHSGDRARSLPVWRRVSKSRVNNEVAYIHHVVKYNKRSTFSFWFISDTNLPNAAVAAEEVIQVFASDLVVEVLDKKNTIGAGWKL